MTDIDWKALAAPFPPDAVSWRVGSISKNDKTKARALAYLDARDVMNRLDAVVGPAGWQCRYSHAGTKTVCDIAIRVGDEWVWKADGAGDTDIEAEKGSLSDAFKRSAVRWGIGRYLYDLPSPWVTINQYKQIEDGEMAKLRALLAKDAAASRPPAPKPEPKPTPAGTYAYIAPDGQVIPKISGREFFVDLKANLKKLKPSQVSAHWAENGRVAQEIVENASPAAQPAAQRLYDECLAIVDEATIPMP